MIIAIIQARISSQRLPGKVLEYFSGDTLLGHIVKRATLSRHIDKIVVATGDHPSNQGILDYCLEHDIHSFAGFEEDVLARFYHAAACFNPDYIVRITADDPFKDPEIIDTAISHIMANKALDYVSNTVIPTYPEGLDVEVFKSTALKHAYDCANLPSEREHVTPFIWKNQNIFNIFNFKHQEDLSDLRWTVDYPEDLLFAKKVYSYFEGKNIFYMQDILEFISKNTHLSRTSKDVMRNESYLKGLLK